MDDLPTPSDTTAAAVGGYEEAQDGQSDSYVDMDSDHAEDSESEDNADDEADDDDDKISSVISDPDIRENAAHALCRGRISDLVDQVRHYQLLYHESQIELQGAQAKIQELADKVAKRRQGRNTQRTWEQDLRNALAGNTPLNYPKVYKTMCLEENMSTVPDTTHPDVLLVSPNQGNGRRCAYPYGMDETQQPWNGPFPFMKLPLNIQARIFKEWLFMKGQLVHCFSRLDRYVVPPPTYFTTPPSERRSGLRGLFYWGPQSVSLARDCRRPSEVLRVLLVSKHFLFMGVHAFYGLNTFAFSSLGEMFRFCQGIGFARLDRLQHLEITFVGNQGLTTRVVNNKKISARTHSLYWLQECNRLRTLVIHINETDKSYMRRKYETQEAIDYMARKTAGQPNFRKTRALRNIQGVDCLYQLRGMNWVRFYDLCQALRKEHRGLRVDVRDWSFTEDITNTACMDKVDLRREASSLPNLRPLVPGFEPTPELFGVVAEAYYPDFDAGLAFDDLRRRRHHADHDTPSTPNDTAHPSPSPSDTSSSSSSSDSSMAPSPPGSPLRAISIRSTPPRSPVRPANEFPGAGGMGTAQDPFVLHDSDAEPDASVKSETTSSKVDVKDEDDAKSAISSVEGNFLSYLRGAAPVWLHNTAVKRSASADGVKEEDGEGDADVKKRRV